MTKDQALALMEFMADLYRVANAPEPAPPATFNLDPDAAVATDPQPQPNRRPTAGKARA